MKNTLLTSMFLSVAFASMAQSDPDMTNAILNYRNGVYDKAKTDIDIAVLKEKINTKPKIYHYRGLIYYNCVMSSLPNVKAAVGDSGALIAYHSFKKAVELDKPDGEYGKPSKIQVENMWPLLINSGGELYQAKKYSAAYTNFQAASEIKPKDTMSVQNMVYTAVELNDAEKVKSGMEKLATINGATNNMYRLAIDYFDRNKLEKDELHFLEKARKAFPNDKVFLNKELSLAYSAGKTGELKKKLFEAAKLDPKNPLYQANLANMYSTEATNLAKSDPKKSALAQDSALTAYKEAILLDSNQFDYNFNVGVIYYNRAKLVLDTANLLPLNAPKAKKDKLEAKSNGIFQVALPYFERAHRKNPKDEGTIDVLERIYGRLRNEAMMNKMTEKKKALGKN